MLAWVFCLGPRLPGHGVQRCDRLCVSCCCEKLFSLGRQAASVLALMCPRWMVDFPIVTHGECCCNLVLCFCPSSEYDGGGLQIWLRQHSDSQQGQIESHLPES